MVVLCGFIAAVYLIVLSLSSMAGLLRHVLQQEE